MNTLNTHVEDYLRLRRALGFKLEREGRWLTGLAAYVDAAGASTLTSELAIAWASERAGAGPNGWAKRLGVARKFATYLQTIVPSTEVPPPGVFPGSPPSAHPLPVVPSGHRRAARGCPGAAPTIARRNPRGDLRAARRLRHADRRSSRPPTKRRRPRCGRDHHPPREVRPHTTRAPTRHRHRSAATLRHRS
jgi:hypothetical protein